MAAREKGSAGFRNRYGIVLCALILLFSTAVKLAGYRHAPTARVLSVMKLWQGELSHAATADIHLFSSHAPELGSAGFVALFGAICLLIRPDEEPLPLCASLRRRIRTAHGQHSQLPRPPPAAC